MIINLCKYEPNQFSRFYTIDNQILMFFLKRTHYKTIGI